MLKLIRKIKSAAGVALSDGLGEAWKYVRAFLLAALSVYALAIVRNVYGLDHTPDWDEARSLLIKSLVDLPTLVDQWVVSPSYSLIVQRPLITAAVLILSGATVVLGVLLVRANNVLNRQSEVLKNADANDALVRQAGIIGRYPHAKQSEDGAPWRSLCDDILCPENKYLYILGANGVDTFGGPGAPLYDVLKSFRGTVNVILCKPGTTPMKRRAAAVGTNAADYKKAISTSVRRLKELRKAGHSIEVRYYDGKPNWKLMITNSTLWVQYYLPSGPHVDETPVWLLESTSNHDGLYHLFHMEFERIWERCAASRVDLGR
ncbi:hypothetical protein BJ123_108144 [Rhodopseudomonas thermotolerans]|uniref:Uncharacterized protein n=2 Tax=Rhodopseudomonas TaxID=1073 RepID=A0A336JM63_9BRAD|nr:MULTISPECIES: hypothetical protein [Rhodopseudomonas]RED36208.1 hypothetical protein BJ125_108143 [Rhodopseudomonas pentothenatexigens]REG03581.1 hypothetical protein BJ123_108144 [Rhodopseudomonas thermotolerans]SSW90768.1 hypothetical protein SAMN05892882_108143 [Rhodopseudomonas pentothenatexigens]